MEAGHEYVGFWGVSIYKPGHCLWCNNDIMVAFYFVSDKIASNFRAEWQWSVCWSLCISQNAVYILDWLTVINRPDAVWTVFAVSLG